MCEREQSCRVLFLKKFELLGPRYRRAGGQGVVQFARCTDPGGDGGDGGGVAVAIKFFLNYRAFVCEEALYRREELRGMMPAISLIESNEEVQNLRHNALVGFRLRCF